MLAQTFSLRLFPILQQPNIQITQVQTITTTQQAQVSDHASHIIDYFHATFHT